MADEQRDQKDRDRVQRQVNDKAGVGDVAFQGGGTLLSEPILVVNQKTKIIELTNEYEVMDREGAKLGAIREVGQTAAKKVIRALTKFDQFLTHRYEIVDGSGGLLLTMTRPAKVFKSTMVVTDAAGAEVGRIVQENMIGKIRFRLEAGGTSVGSINAENWRAWNFNIKDEAGEEIARITKTFEGIARTLFTTADFYVVHLHRQLADPLRQLVVAAAVSVDTALKQDNRGLN
ncbi:MAG: hypothetical protein QOI60_873 [Actinomycetota bacterium]|jgi:uncharacterized protein YxjI|nr:hypothetical protein [Actinomycetota bacterium]MEA2580317.1 hypothetical protein [Actinomycetota bacterium]